MESERPYIAESLQSKNVKPIDFREVPYSELENSHKRRINELFTQAGILTSQIANKMSEIDMISAFSQFCKEAKLLDGNTIEVVIENPENLYIYRGSKGNFIGAAFSFKKPTRKMEKWQHRNKR